MNPSPETELPLGCRAVPWHCHKTTHSQQTGPISTIRQIPAPRANTVPKFSWRPSGYPLQNNQFALNAVKIEKMSAWQLL